MNYDKWSVGGYNTGNSRNGTYSRSIVTRFGKIEVEIPRDRNGDFQQHTVPRYKRNDGCLEDMVIQMYSRGITTTEIVHEFHSRNLSKRYIVIYGDATYINVRCDTVQKEALPILMGIIADGNKEILDYQLFPKAQYQACWVYLMRSICRNIRKKEQFPNEE